MQTTFRITSQTKFSGTGLAEDVYEGYPEDILGSFPGGGISGNLAKVEKGQQFLMDERRL